MLAYVEYPSETLTGETAQGILVPGRLENLEHHLSIDQF